MDTEFLNIDALSTSLENTQPIQSFRLFTGFYYCGSTALEFYWGLEKGELDLWTPLNQISVRADIGRLFLNSELALVPSTEIIQTMIDSAKINRHSNIDQRRSCFEALPPQKYEYSLIPLTKFPPNLFIVNESSSLSQSFTFVRPDYPRVKLDVHPVFAVVHCARELLQSIHEHLPCHKMVSLVTIMYCGYVPREFKERSSIQHQRITPGPGADEDEESGNDSSGTMNDDDYSSEEESMKIYSWLETIASESFPDAGLVSKISEDEVLATEPRSTLGV